MHRSLGLFAVLLACSVPSAAKTTCALTGEDFDICSSCSELVSGDALQVIRAALADDKHRRWHHGWHLLRERIDPVLKTLHAGPAGSPERRAAQAQIDDWRAQGSIVGNAREFSRLHCDSGGVSGEDFLYMHREMLKMAQQVLKAAGQPCIAGWKSLPASIDDPVWPVPIKPPSDASTADPKAFWQNKFDDLKRNDRFLRDPEYLRLATLNKLAQDAELYLHNVLHLLYSDAADHCKGDSDPSPACDDLNTFWAASANRHFVKIHGYIDDFTGLWLKAHGYNEIAIECAGRPACYQWKGTWLGNMPVNDMPVSGQP